MTRHLAVIDPAVNTAETDCFNRIVLESRIPVTYHLPKLSGMESLLQLKSPPAGILILGSGSSVHDAFPWQAEMNQWLLPHLRGGVPTLGLCYGHQLIASLFGGKVDFVFADKHKHLGLRTVTLSPNPLWKLQTLQGPLVVSHREAVVLCPPDFEIVGKSPEVAIDAIAHRSLPIWGFQSHPESTLSFLKSQGIPVESKESSLAFGHSIVRFFLEYVAG